MKTDDTVGLADYMAILRGRRFLGICIALPVILVGTVVAIALPDVYRSTARFRAVSSGIETAVPGENELFDQYIMGLADKVLSAETLVPIVRDIDPYPESEGGEGAAVALLRSNVSVNMVQQAVLQPGSGRERMINTGFSVSVGSRSPDKAAAIAQRLTSAFVETGRADSLDAANNRLKFFAGEAERLRTSIADLEGQLAEFKSNNFDRLPESLQANVSVRARTEQELETVEREIRTLQQNRVFVEQQLKRAEAGASSAGTLQQLEAEYARKAAIYEENHPDLIALRRQIELLRREGGLSPTDDTLQLKLEERRAALSEARERYSEDHPDVRRLSREIDALETRVAAGETVVANLDTPVAAQLRTQLNSAETQIVGLQSRAVQLRGRLSQLDRQLGATPEVERGYLSLTRGLDTARSQFNEMITRKMDAELELAAIESGSADRFRLVAEAAEPRAPAGPPRLGIVVLSAIMASVLSLGSILLAELLDPKIRGIRGVRRAFGFEPLVAVPVIRNSVYKSGVRRRVITAAGAVLVGVPVVFLAVRIFAA